MEGINSSKGLGNSASGNGISSSTSGILPGFRLRFPTQAGELMRQPELFQFKTCKVVEADILVGSRHICHSLPFHWYLAMNKVRCVTHDVATAMATYRNASVTVPAISIYRDFPTLLVTSLGWSRVPRPIQMPMAKIPKAGILWSGWRRLTT